VASGDSFDAAPQSAEWAIFLDGVDHVLAAGGVEAAVSGEEGAEGCAVGEDEENEEFGDGEAGEGGAGVAVL
jgi:hypothetical protein